MPSKLTQAEKQRRAGVREAWREVTKLADGYKRRSDRVGLVTDEGQRAYFAWVGALNANLRIRALLAPKRKRKA